MHQGQVTYKGLPPAQFRDEISAIDAPEHSDARRLLEIWQARPADGLVVGRDIPSRMMAPLLSHIVVWEPVDNGADFRARLAGDELHRRFDGDIKGRLMSDLFPPVNLDKHIEACRHVTVMGAPSVFRTRLVCAGVQQLRADVVILPAVPPERVGKWALSGAFFF